jgi:cobalt-zinc-cadmium efflux system outer membrane protein
MFISLRHAFAAACIAIVIGVAGSASAAPLTLAEAIERTLAGNPDLRVYAPRLRAAEQRERAAALRPPFELEAEVQDAFGTGRASGFDSAETTVALSHVIELGNQRGRRVDAATAGTTLATA